MQVPVRAAPDYLQYYPTLRCNRSCTFCFNRSLPEMEDMGLEAFSSMLEILGSRCVTTIDMIGGEPTLHPEILMLLAGANERGFHVNLSSNGSDVGLLEEIMNRSDKVTVGLSINDRGTLDQTAAFIKKNHPAIKTVFSRSVNHALIADILDLKPKAFYAIYRDAISKRDLDATIPFPRFMHEALTRLNGHPGGMVYCSGFLPDAAYPELDNVRCPAGTTKLGVMPDGSVYPCNLFFGNAGFLLGNILIDPFEAIWSHRALDFFRAYSGNSCTQRSCAFHSDCHGGCPAQALMLTGDVAAPDPRCSGR
jgi:radical SAM protein with 4Fe4S-binding SPASM domain